MSKWVCAQSGCNYQNQPGREECFRCSKSRDGSTRNPTEKSAVFSHPLSDMLQKRKPLKRVVFSASSSENTQPDSQGASSSESAVEDDLELALKLSLEFPDTPHLQRNQSEEQLQMALKMSLDSSHERKESEGERMIAELIEQNATLHDHISVLTNKVSGLSGRLAAGESSQKSLLEQECVICLENAATHIVLECLHLCLCEQCAPNQLQGCPICREPVARIGRVHTG